MLALHPPTPPLPQDRRVLDRLLACKTTHKLIEANPVDVLISRDRSTSSSLPIRSASPDFRKAAQVLSRVLPNEAHILGRGGLESDSDRGLAFRINPDGSIPRRPDGPRGEG